MHQQQLVMLRVLITRVPGDNPTSDKIRSGISRLEKEATALYEIVTGPADPMVSAAAIAMRVDAEKSRLRALAARSRGELDTLVANFRASEEAARRSRASLKADQYAPEIRTAVRAFTNEQRNNFLATLLQSKDSTTAAAILDAPPMLCGMTEQESENFREAFLEKLGGPSAKAIADEMQSAVDVALQTVEMIARPEGAAPPLAAQMAASLAARAV